jgi:hypothetical protein
MTDMDLIRELRPDVRLADADELAPARGQLAAAIATEISAESLPSASRQRPAAVGLHHSAPQARSFWHARRLAVAGVAAGVAAAGVAAALIVVPGHGAHPGHRPAGAAGQSRHVVTHPFAGRLTAARFLNAAARAALRQPTAAPSPDQWVYSENEAANGAKTQIWLPADGSKAGIVGGLQGGTEPACTIAQAESTKCRPDAGYFPDMPINSKLLFPYLDKVQIASDAALAGQRGAWLANQLARGVFFLMQQTYLRPAQRAALYELMARTPGFTVVPGVRDAIGRAGVGVEWTYGGGKGAVIFDPRTYAYLGVRTWPVSSFHGPGAHQYDGAALIKLAVVNSPPAKARA